MNDHHLRLAKIRKPSLFAPSPDAWARASVAAIGTGAVVVPYWAHKLQSLGLSIIPALAWNKYKYGFGASIRKRALAKAEKAAKAQ